MFNERRKKCKASFTYNVIKAKNYLRPNLTNCQEPELGFFGHLEPEQEPLEKNSRSQSRLGKKSGARASWEKNQEPEPLEIKSQEPEPEPLKYLPAPQP